MSTSDNQSWVRSVCSSWAWRWPKCECLLVILTWLTGLLGACFRAVCRLGRVSSPILPTVNPRSQSPKKKCASWWNWCRKSKCQCTSPTCRRYRRWKKDWRKFPARCFRRMRNLRWPVWEPDQNSLFTRVIKASRLDGFKMSLKEGMHFAGRILYVVTYKIFTGIAIYLIFVSSVKIRTHPMMYKDVGKVAMEDTPFPGLDIYPSHIFPDTLLQEAEKRFYNISWSFDDFVQDMSVISSKQQRLAYTQIHNLNDRKINQQKPILKPIDEFLTAKIQGLMLYEQTKRNGTAIDAFGETWMAAQAAKLYYYVSKRCQAVRSHSRFYGFSNLDESLEPNTLLDDHNNFTFRDNTDDKDFQKILQLVEKHQGTIDCSKILQACRWGPDGIRKCSELFEIKQSETGNFCRLKRLSSATFNIEEAIGDRWNIDKHSFSAKSVSRKNEEIQDSPLFQKVAGSEFGLTFVLIMDTENMACPINEGAAYMVYVHSPLDNQNVRRNGIPIAPNHEVYINVGAEITLADPDIFNLDAESRQCYFQKEGYFLNSKDYTEGNCRMECRSLLFQRECKCQPLGTTSGTNQTICGPQDAECEELVESKIRAAGYSRLCMNLSPPMNCYHGCTEVVYTTVVTSTPYFGESALLGEFHLKLGQYASTVRIFFDADFFPAKQMQQQYDFWEYVGLVGGLLGMLIGFDFMTLVHLIYAFGIWMKGLWLKRKKSRVAQAFFNMTNHVDLVKALSTHIPSTPIIAIGSAVPSTRHSDQPRTWPGEMTKLDARLKSIYVIRKGAENDHILPDDSIDLDEPANLIEPVEIVVPTGQKIRNALFDNMPKKVAFKNIFTIPKRVAPADRIAPIELLDIEPAKLSDMELADLNLIQPVTLADSTGVAPLEGNYINELVDGSDVRLVDPATIEPADPIEITPLEGTDIIKFAGPADIVPAKTANIAEPNYQEPIGPIILEPLNIDTLEPTNIETAEQTRPQLDDPGVMQSIEPTELEPAALADANELFEPIDEVDPIESRNRIPLYKHKEYLENGQVVIVLNPKKPSFSPKENMSNSKDEL